jgi:uncharacterized protein (DUF433 family)
MRANHAKQFSAEDRVMQTIQAINSIAVDPNVRSGRPHIAGTTIEVSAIAIAKIVHMQSPEEIASDYKLTLAQVYAALAYYYDHKSEIDASIQDRRKLAEQLKEQIIGNQPAPLHRRKS